MADKQGPVLKETGNGLVLTDGNLSVQGDFHRILHRAKKGKIEKELLVRAAKGRGRGTKAKGKVAPPDKEELPLAIDATAGLGEDAFLLAAAGFQVILFEKDPIIYALLTDSIRRAEEDPELAGIVSRMDAREGDGIDGMHRLAEEVAAAPEVILLDPMFPERNKSGLIKKKFQLLQNLEAPSTEKDEEELLAAARLLNPKKIIIKRPLKGPYLAGVTPSHSLKGSVIRYDVILP